MRTLNDNSLNLGGPSQFRIILFLANPRQNYYNLQIIIEYINLNHKPAKEYTKKKRRKDEMFIFSVLFYLHSYLYISFIIQYGAMEEGKSKLNQL